MPLAEAQLSCIRFSHPRRESTLCELGQTTSSLVQITLSCYGQSTLHLHNPSNRGPFAHHCSKTVAIDSGKRTRFWLWLQQYQTVETKQIMTNSLLEVFCAPDSHKCQATAKYNALKSWHAHKAYGYSLECGEYQLYKIAGPDPEHDDQLHSSSYTSSFSWSWDGYMVTSNRRSVQITKKHQSREKSSCWTKPCFLLLRISSGKHKLTCKSDSFLMTIWW